MNTDLTSKSFWSASSLCEIVDALGAPVFPDRLFSCAARFTGADLCSAFTVRGEGEIEFLFARGIDTTDPKFPEAASVEYARDFWRFDPLFKRVTTLGPERASILRQPWNVIPKSEYRAFCYERPGVVERISIAASDGLNVSLFNLYRSRSRGPFSSRDFTTACTLSGFFSGTLSKHLAIANMGTQLHPPPHKIAARIRFRHPTLSEREVDVCSALLVGKSAKEAARICSIKVSTLITYKKRAFAKLGIATIGELVRLYEGDNGNSSISGQRQ